MGSMAAWTIYSLATLIGNFAVAVTGLGMAIFFLFVCESD